MLALERHRKILDLILEQGSLRTVDVATRLEVTEETIRRDFEKLELEGQIVRAHGGAVGVQKHRRELPFYERQSFLATEKKIIATEALKRIIVGDTIAVDASSTCLELVKLLPDQAITVVTNAMQVVMELSTRSQIKVICTGGILQHGSLSFSGALAEMAMDRYRVNRFFFSCRGVDPRRGLSEANDEGARLKKRMLDLADEAILLADHSKLGLESSYFFAEVKDADLLLTDSGADQSVVAELVKAGLDVQLAA